MIRVVAAVIERAGTLLVCQRPRHKRHGGLWEFPGGKVEPGEDDAAAVHRELQEELGVVVEHVGQELFRRADPGSPYTIAFLSASISGDPVCLEHDALRWEPLHELLRLDLAPSDLEFVLYLSHNQMRTGMEEMAVAAFERAVSRCMLELYGITWTDAAGDLQPLLQAMAAGESPAEFVNWWGEKYGLTRRDTSHY